MLTALMQKHLQDRRAPVKEGEHVLIVGAGPVGMGAAQFALAAGGNVCCMDINDQRLEFVKDKHLLRERVFPDLLRRPAARGRS